ncbi:odorant receptor 2a-like [Maniola jurtina]|uniref:odorant receptor 2a-like n=1 Tax=Maniola jurtina TaxID=191418 RepID=UPI001E68F1D3|nr:odorant receptor 2a-like [Maniola jurtina]
MASQPQWPLKFEEVTRSSMIFSRLNGSYPTILTFNKLWWINNIFWPSYSFFCFYISFYSVIYYDFKYKNYADAIRNGTMSIVSLTVAFKHLLLLRHRVSIKDIIENIDRDYEAAKDFTEAEKNTVLRYARLGTNICKFWVVMSIVTGLLFPVKSIALMGYYYFKGEFKLIPVMDLSYPFINDYKNNPVMFCILFLSCVCFAMYAATSYIAFDPLVPAIVAHMCGQLELISNRMLRLFSNAKSVDEIDENLKQINIKLMEIYRIINTVQKNFAILYEFVMKTTTFLMSFSAFQIVEGLKHNGISVEFVSFFFGSILHFYSPCYFSNLLMDKSEELRQAIYSCGWELQPDIRIRKTILLMLTKTTKSVVIRTVFVPICLDTFAEMARQAYGIYNLMNAAWG